MRNVKRVIITTLCSFSLMAMSAGTVFAAEGTDRVVYTAPYADGIDIAPVNQNARSTTRTYNSPSFTTGVYLSGAPFTMDSSGTAKFTKANQSAIDSSSKADVSYQVLDNYTNKVYSGVRKIGNSTGMSIDASSKVQAKQITKIYLYNNAGVSTSASGTFGW